MTSEADYYTQQRKQENEHRFVDRKLARQHILANWERYGFSAEDRDEVLAALGLAQEEDLRKNLDLYGGGNLSKAGLVSNAVKAVGPRTPPQRASWP